MRRAAPTAGCCLLLFACLLALLACFACLLACLLAVVVVVVCVGVVLGRHVAGLLLVAMAPARPVVAMQQHHLQHERSSANCSMRGAQAAELLASHIPGSF